MDLKESVKYCLRYDDFIGFIIMDQSELKRLARTISERVGNCTQIEIKLIREYNKYALLFTILKNWENTAKIDSSKFRQQMDAIKYGKTLQYINRYEDDVKCTQDFVKEVKRLCDNFIGDTTK